ncbi:hypothetical protein KY362_01205 [Candidatus Woesearchaeota archaeon]|nr:hypothetical protein [Candidatus Woesearchaeota archaeon]
MPSKIQEIAHKIAVRDRAIFDELVEFEKKKRIRSKEKMNFTVDKVVASRFKKHCRKEGYNMSALVEKAMRDMLR